MAIHDFYAKIHEYQKVFAYFNAINTNNFSKLPTESKKGESAKVHAKRMLDKEIQEKSLFLFKLKNGESRQTPITIFNDLFEAAYFFLNLSKNTLAEMKICDNCGHLFEVTHKRQRFCSALSGRKRLSCEMAYNNRLKKKKREGEK